MLHLYPHCFLLLIPIKDVSVAEIEQTMRMRTLLITKSLFAAEAYAEPVRS